MPAGEELRMPDEREVVQSDGERHGRPQRAAEGRAMEQVGVARGAREPGVVPPRVPRDRGRLARPAERAWHDLDSLPAGERAEQPATCCAVPARVWTSGETSTAARITPTLPRTRRGTTPLPPAR